MSQEKSSREKMRKYFELAFVIYFLVFSLLSFAEFY